MTRGQPHSHLHFAHAVARPDDQLDLAVCALLIAERERPGLDVAAYVRRLDTLAADVVQRGGSLAALQGVLFVELGLRGNEDDYYDPRNSFIDQVLDRRLGIPIALAVVCIEVGQRAGLSILGVGFPGHFLCLAKTASGDRYLDPFRGGKLLERPDLEALVKGILGPEAKLRDEHLAVAKKRAILSRMLSNLRAIYQRRGDAARERIYAELADDVVREPRARTHGEAS